MKYLSAILLFLFSFHAAYSQCGVNTLDLGPDTTVCIGDYYLFDAGSGYLTYDWSNGGTGRYINVNVPGTYTCEVGIADTGNLVTNGDFSAGNTGFTSSYVYGTGGSWGLLSNPGQYAVSTNANLTHNNFPSCNDHTSGTGNYMIMNGSSVANTNVWCQTVTVIPNTDYVFSGWFTSVDPGSPAQLNLTVGGVALGAVFNLSATTCNWTRYSRTWTSGPTQTSANICIRSQSTSGGGNDFAVDDIMFTKTCTFIDTVILSADTLPIANLGPDTVICSGSNYLLDATDDPTFGYAWSNGTTIPISTITSTDSNLMVTVTNGFCEAVDAAIVTFSSQPIISLGNDTILCPGDNFDLSAPWPGASYLWSDNSTGNILNVASPGQYWVGVTDNCGVTYDTINVSYVVYPLVDLGADTNICDGTTLTLNAGYPNASYSWNTGSSDSVISVTQTGQYSVNVQLGNCVDQDTINVTVDPFPTVDLGNDTILCAGETLVLQANNQNATYLWNDGSVGAAKQVTSAGTYWVKVSIGNCESSDTIAVVYNDFPLVELGSDTFICGNNVAIFDVTQANVNYLWNDNSTGSSLTVSQTMKVWVEISNFCGVVSDTVNVYVNPYPVADLGSDTSICEGESFTKDVFNIGATYNWNDGSSLSSYTFSSTGTYTVTVTANNCETVDALDLTIIDQPVVDLGEDTLVCIKSGFMLSVPSGFDAVSWMDGSSDLTFLVEESGAQWVEVTNDICIGSDTVWVGMENCETFAEMPNIFTPNGDGMNDLFSPVYTVGIEEMRTQIYDRWGKLVFETNNHKIDWNGESANGNTIPDGVYYWVIDIVGIDSEKYEQKGTVTLIRE